MKINLSPEVVQTIINALYVASDRFKEDAKTCRTAHQSRLAEQFDRQVIQSAEALDILMEFQ